MKYLKEFRLDKGVSQQVVADYLEITRQAYSNYENGNREPDFEMLLKLGEFFGVSTDTLLRGKDKTPAGSGERQITDDDIKFALFGGRDEITDAMYEEVKNFAAYVKQRESAKNKFHK